MRRLLNALAFAAVVIAAFVMDSNLPVQRLASNPVVARIAGRLRGNELPAVQPLPGLPPQIEQAKLERAMERMQAAQERLVRVDTQRMEARMRAAQHAAALTNCKVTKIDQ